MIIKLSNGAYYEFTKTEYAQFVAEVMVHFNTESKLTVNFQADTRVEAAKLLLNTVAENTTMSREMKDDYFRIAFELIEQYNFDLMANGKEPLKAKDFT